MEASKPGQFNQMMNQVIGEFAKDNEDEQNEQATASNIDQARKSDDKWNRSSLAQSAENLPPHMLT